MWRCKDEMVHVCCNYSRRGNAVGRAFPPKNRAYGTQERLVAFCGQWMALPCVHAYTLTTAQEHEQVRLGDLNTSSQSSVKVLNCVVCAWGKGKIGMENSAQNCSAENARKVSMESERVSMHLELEKRIWCVAFWYFCNILNIANAQTTVIVKNKNCRYLVPPSE